MVEKLEFWGDVIYGWSLSDRLPRKSIGFINKGFSCSTKTVKKLKTPAKVWNIFPSVSVLYYY